MRASTECGEIEGVKLGLKSFPPKNDLIESRMLRRWHGGSEEVDLTEQRAVSL